MKLTFVNVMQELQRFDSTAYITQPPVPLAVLAGVTPSAIETALEDEQSEELGFDGDAFAFSVTTQNARAVYDHADALRARGKRVILGGIHPTVCPDEAATHADAVVTGEAEGIWPTICDDLLSNTLRDRYEGSPTPSSEMRPVDYRFFGRRRYLTPASLFATRGCTRRCAFCVSSRHLGPYRTKPLAVLEQEIDQLTRLHPRSFLQFTDDNLLASRATSRELLALLRRKGRRFITMITVDQLCDGALLEELARSGCLGVAVGVESVDDDNCAAVHKDQNLSQPLEIAVGRAAELGLQTAALIMVGLPHDSPERLRRTHAALARLPFSIHDVRLLRAYPSTDLYAGMLARGEVTPDWWLDDTTRGTANHLLPSCLAMHFHHPRFAPLELQELALGLTADLNAMDRASMARIAGVGRRGRSLGFATTALFVRRRLGRQARTLLHQVRRLRGAPRAELG